VGGGKKQELGSWKISSGRRNFNCRADWLCREARLREEEKKGSGRICCRRINICKSRKR
jgi:hypothetical protein